MTETRERPRWRAGLRSRMAISVVLIALITCGGTAIGLFVTMQKWLYSNASTTAAYIFSAEITELANARPTVIARSELANLVGPDVTLVYDGSVLSQGSVHLEDLSGPGMIPVGNGDIDSVQRQIDGRRVVLSAAVAVTTADGQVGVVSAYADRTLPGIKAGIINLTLVSAAASAIALIVAGGSAWWLGGRIVTPLRQLNAAASRSSAGQFDVALPDARITEVAELAAGFNQMQQEYAETLARRNRFVSDVSHELRTPLAAIVPAAEILVEERESMSADAQQATEILTAEVHAFAALVEDLIEISRHDDRRASFDAVDLDVVDLVERTIQRRGWSTEVTVRGADEPVRLRADPRRLDVAIANLVTNALLHGEPPVEVAVTLRRDSVAIAVSDHGAGIADGDQTRIFERFVKGDSGHGRRDGNGLGLALARSNVALHGGSISVTSLREPTTLTIVLPRTPSS